MRFDMICEANDIEHRLTKALPSVVEGPIHSWTNRQLGRASTTRTMTSYGRTLADFMAAYDFALRLKTLSGLTPYEYIAKICTPDQTGSS